MTTSVVIDIIIVIIICVIVIRRINILRYQFVSSNCSWHFAGCKQISISVCAFRCGNHAQSFRRYVACYIFTKISGVNIICEKNLVRVCNVISHNASDPLKTDKRISFLSYRSDCYAFCFYALFPWTVIYFCGVIGTIKVLREICRCFCF